MRCIDTAREMEQPFEGYGGDEAVCRHYPSAGLMLDTRPAEAVTESLANEDGSKITTGKNPDTGPKRSVPSRTSLMWTTADTRPQRTRRHQSLRKT